MQFNKHFWNISNFVFAWLTNHWDIERCTRLIKWTNLSSPEINNIFFCSLRTRKLLERRYTRSTCLCVFFLSFLNSRVDTRRRRKANKLLGATWLICSNGMWKMNKQHTSYWLKQSSTSRIVIYKLQATTEKRRNLVKIKIHNKSKCHINHEKYFF